MEFYTFIGKKGSKIFYRGIRNGRDVSELVPFKPKLYVRCLKNKATHKDFYGGPVAEMEFDTSYDMFQFLKSYGDIPNEVWGNKNVVTQFIWEKFGPNIEYNLKDIQGAFIDIEVLTREKVNGTWIDGGFPNAAEAKFPVNAICQYCTKDKKYHVFSLAKWSKENSCFPDLAENTDYHYYETEIELLRGWLRFWKSAYPHYITGWNVENFDIPYLVNRITTVLGDARELSPCRDVIEHTINTKYGTEKTYDIVGIAVLDYLELYKKHTFVTRESYTLDFIAETELQEHKKEFTGTHGSFFWDNPQGFQDYNIKDVNLVVGIDAKLQLLNLVLSLSYFAGINYTDTFSPIRIWDTLIYRECMNRGIIVSCNTIKKEREEYEGAYVFPTKNAMYKAIASFDATSLYPSVNRTWNIGADTIVGNEERDQIISEIKTQCIEHSNEELARLAHSNIPLIEYYRDNGLPEYVTDILKKHKVSLSLNWQFFSTEHEAITTYLQSKLFNERKNDKEKAKYYTQREKDLYQEILRRKLAFE